MRQLYVGVPCDRLSVVRLGLNTFPSVRRLLQRLHQVICIVFTQLYRFMSHKSPFRRWFALKRPASSKLRRFCHEVSIDVHVSLCFPYVHSISGVADCTGCVCCAYHVRLCNHQVCVLVRGYRLINRVFVRPRPLAASCLTARKGLPPHQALQFLHSLALTRLSLTPPSPTRSGAKRRSGRHVPLR